LVESSLIRPDPPLKRSRWEKGGMRDKAKHGARDARRAASCNEASPRARVSVMTDYRGINSLFNQQTAWPACRLSNKIWRPWPEGRPSLPASHRKVAPPLSVCHSFVSGACIAGCTSHSAPAIFDRPPSICNFSLRGSLAALTSVVRPAQ